MAIFCPFLLFAQESDGLLLDFSFKKDNYDIFAMLEFKVSIKNNGSQPIEIFYLEKNNGEYLKTGSFRTLHIEYRKKKTSKWKCYAEVPKKKYNESDDAFPFSPGTIQLLPNAITLSGWLAIKPGHKGNWGEMREPERLLINKPGNFEFRLCGAYGDKKFYSGSKNLFVSKQKGKSAKKVRRFLNETPKPYFLNHLEYRLMSYPSYLDRNDTLLEPYARLFLEKFPQSDLAPLANLFLAKCYFIKIDRMGEGQNFIEKNINIFGTIKKFCEKCKSYPIPKYVENECLSIMDSVGTLILWLVFNNDLNAMKSSEIGKEFPLDY